MIRDRNLLKCSQTPSIILKVRFLKRWLILHPVFQQQLWLPGSLYLYSSACVLWYHGSRSRLKVTVSGVYMMQINTTLYSGFTTNNINFQNRDHSKNQFLLNENSPSKEAKAVVQALISRRDAFRWVVFYFRTWNMPGLLLSSSATLSHFFVLLLEWTAAISFGQFKGLKP